MVINKFMPIPRVATMGTGLLALLILQVSGLGKSVLI